MPRDLTPRLGAMIRRFVLAAALICQSQVGLLAAGAVDPTTPPTIVAGHLFDRITVVGASASDGFGVSVRADQKEGEPKPPAVSMNLADVLRYGATEASTPKHPVIHHYASGFFFMNPGPVGRGEIDRALKANSTLLVALDFLFWYVYGTVDASGEPFADENARVANLEVGLAQLDRVLCEGVPIVVGDIPDMHDAIGKMLSKPQVPKAETLKLVNERLSKWVHDRPGVRMIPLASILDSLKSGAEISLGGKVWDPTKLGALLQKDQLHPTYCGTVALTAGILDIAHQFDQASAKEWQLDPELIRQCVIRDSVKVAKPSSPSAAPPVAAPASPPAPPAPH